MKTNKTVAIFLSLCAFLSACNTHKPMKPDILRANVDTTVNPGNDFYMYSNGEWFKHNPIPPTESRWGIGNLVQDEIYENLRQICENAAATKDATKNSATQRIGDLYASAMDSAAVDKAGADPIKEELTEIAAIKDISGVVNMIAKLQTYRVGPAFSLYVGQDEKNSDAMALHLQQGGLGLPNRDYYYNTDNRTQNIRVEYVKYIGTTMAHTGDVDSVSVQNAQSVMQLETMLALKSRKLEDLRDPYKNYNKMSISQLEELTPTVKWGEFLTAAGVTKQPDSIIVGQPEFFQNLELAFKIFPIETWKTYLRWQFVGNYGDMLGGDFEKEHFHFYKTVLTGTEKEKPRWKRVIDYENNAVGELLGQEFVKEYFPAESKERYKKVVNDIVEAYHNHIQNLDWMSPATKEKALAKLSTVTKKIGYPDKWKDFTGMEISRQPFVRNAINVDKFWYNYDLRKLYKPVDRTEWDMNPQEYNAYYNPSNNEIVLPAACFAVPGYKDNELDDAIIYGYAGGSTIGHELTHGFDDEGRLYDAKGNLHDWWTKEDIEKFNAKTKMYVDQFNSYVVLDSMHVNGKASLGENIADLGGVVLGLEAFKKTEEYKSGKKVAGFTPLQRYFLAYGLSWMTTERNERLANQILTDVHAPAKFRVNGPVSNVPEFYEAFGVKQGDSLWRPEAERVKIW